MHITFLNISFELEEIRSTNSLSYSENPDPLNNLKNCNEIYVIAMKIVAFSKSNCLGTNLQQKNIF